MANSQREQQPTEGSKNIESEAGHFMDSKENKLYYFIQLGLLRLENITKVFGEAQSPRY